MTLPATEAIGELIKKFLPGYSFSGNANSGPFIAGKKNLLFQQKLSFSFMTYSSDGEQFSGMLQGMHNFYAAIETPHKQVQTALLAKILLFNLMVIVAAERDMDDDTFGAVMGMAKEADGLIFLPPGNLYNSGGDLVFNASGETELSESALTVPAESTAEHTKKHTEVQTGEQLKVTESGLSRKQRSLSILRTYSVPASETLPPIVGDEDANLRTKEEIIQRSTALLMTAIYAEIVKDQGLESARATIKKTIDTYQAASFLSPEENDFLEDDNPKERDRAKFIWRYECYWVALWALSFVETLDFPMDICDVGKMIRFLHESGSMKTFSKQAVLRSLGEILDQADLIYRYDWACADARANGLEAPSGLSPGVVVERHRMLNWIIGYMGQEWDEVRTDT
jgi:hypothetical protein